MKDIDSGNTDWKRQLSNYVEATGVNRFEFSNWLHIPILSQLHVLLYLKKMWYCDLKQSSFIVSFSSLQLYCDLLLWPLFIMFPFSLKSYFWEGSVIRYPLGFIGKQNWWYSIAGLLSTTRALCEEKYFCLKWYLHCI